MESAKDIILAARITKVMKLTSLSEDYTTGVNPFSVRVEPKSNSDLELGDTVKTQVMMPDTDGAYVEVPLTLGCWNEYVCLGLKASSGLNLSTMDVYVAPIKNLVL